MQFPNLSLLSINGQTSKRFIKIRWLKACGAERPNFKSWENLTGKDKKRFMHAVAAEADEDEPGPTGEDGNYVTPYDELDIDEVLGKEVWSVEHVVPRSDVISEDTSAKDDPIGWMTATRTANSRRSNYPLMLWPDQHNGQLALPRTLVRFEGELHYVPPLEQRARIARKWMYMRATYSGDLKPPSRAQRLYSAQIVAWAKAYPIQPAEQRVNDLHDSMFEWSNPLLKPNPEEWYDNVEWRHLMFS